MTVPPDASDGPRAKGTKTLADEARAELSQLHRDVLVAEERVVATSAAVLIEANEKLIVATLRAHSEAEASTKRLAEASRTKDFDALTGLATRALLRERFEQAIVHARRDAKLLALLFMDLDDFKQINDTLGHAVGDEALAQAARCFVSAVREADTVSRYGGDEFLILLTSISNVSDAVVVAEKVITSLASQNHVGAHPIKLTASIGISVYPADGADVDTLIARADTAMYVAKNLGRGKIACHSETSTTSQRRE